MPDMTNLLAEWRGDQAAFLESMQSPQRTLKANDPAQEFEDFQRWLLCRLLGDLIEEVRAQNAILKHAVRTQDGARGESVGDAGKPGSGKGAADTE